MNHISKYVRHYVRTWDLNTESLDRYLSLTGTYVVSIITLDNEVPENDKVPENAIIGPLLDLNESDEREEVVMSKILQSHNDFDMLPFFEWEFKVLPLVINWLERASECEMPENFESNIEPRKLSTIYQFVRDMPVLYVETRLRKELEDIKARAKQMQEEQRMLEERKMSIMRRLGRL